MKKNVQLKAVDKETQEVEQSPCGTIESGVERNGRLKEGGPSSFWFTKAFKESEENSANPIHMFA